MRCELGEVLSFARVGRAPKVLGVEARDEARDGARELATDGARDL